MGNLLKFMSTVRTKLHTSVVPLYRTAAIITLYSALVLVLSYAILLGFYAVNTSWVAPIIVSPSNDTILQMTSQLVSSKQMLNALVLDRDRLRGSLDDMKKQRNELHNLDSQLTLAIVRQQVSNKVNGVELSSLIDQKKVDIAHTRSIVDDVTWLSVQLEKDLAAGLITKGDAATQRTALTQFGNTFTDSKVGEVLLRDNLRQKTTVDVDSLITLGQRATLESEVAQLGINIGIGEQQVKTDQDQIEGINRAMATVQQSPFYLATQTSKSLKFAFVPYDNESHVTVGASVYDCYLNMVICREVGVVKRVFTDEQKATHPVFKTDVRGFFIQLEMTRPESAKSKTLFLNRKPLLF